MPFSMNEILPGTNNDESIGLLEIEDVMKHELRPGGPRNPTPITLSVKPGIG